MPLSGADDDIRRRSSSWVDCSVLCGGGQGAVPALPLDDDSDALPQTLSLFCVKGDVLTMAGRIRRFPFFWGLGIPRTGNGSFFSIALESSFLLVLDDSVVVVVDDSPRGGKAAVSDTDGASVTFEEFDVDVPEENPPVVLVVVAAAVSSTSGNESRIACEIRRAIRSRQVVLLGRLPLACFVVSQIKLGPRIQSISFFQDSSSFGVGLSAIIICVI